jgi:hypothetical protein
VRSPLGRISAALPVAVVALATAVALDSAWQSGGHVWRRLTGDYRSYAAYTDLQRRHAVLDKIPLPSDVFDFYAAHLLRGDRIYYQVLPSGYGRFCDLRTCIAQAGNFYLLPSVQSPDLRSATVVISYYADPSRLHRHFPLQVQAGLQPIFVSRLRSP